MVTSSMDMHEWDMCLSALMSNKEHSSWCTPWPDVSWLTDYISGRTGNSHFAGGFGYINFHFLSGEPSLINVSKADWLFVSRCNICARRASV